MALALRLAVPTKKLVLLEFQALTGIADKAISPYDFPFQHSMDAKERVYFKPQLFLSEGFCAHCAHCAHEDI